MLLSVLMIVILLLISCFWFWLSNYNESILNQLSNLLSLEFSCLRFLVARFKWRIVISCLLVFLVFRLKAWFLVWFSVFVIVRFSFIIESSVSSTTPIITAVSTVSPSSFLLLIWLLSSLLIVFNLLFRLVIVVALLFNLLFLFSDSLRCRCYSLLFLFFLKCRINCLNGSCCRSWADKQWDWRLNCWNSCSSYDPLAFFYLLLLFKLLYFLLSLLLAFRWWRFLFIAYWLHICSLLFRIC